jgi:multidrug efflux pump subunit AcrB
MSEQHSADPEPSPKGIIARIVDLFLQSQLSIILIVISFALGAAAILITPREEEPQIVVPMADIFVQAPGASAKEVEKLVASPLEKLLWQIDGVEYVYSTSRKDMAMVTVRFYVGQDRERSLVKLHNQIRMHTDQVPPIVRNWVIKPVEIDDVPIVNLTLFSKRYSDFELRRIGEEALCRLTQVQNISRAEIVGGRPREVRVELSPERMAGLTVSPLQVIRSLKGADASVNAGSFSRTNQEINVSANLFLRSAQDVRDLVVGVHQGRPVYLRDVAKVLDGPQEADQYCRIGFSHYFQEHRKSPGDLNQLTGQELPSSAPAVTLALAKKKGTNAVWVARDVLEKIEELKGSVIPDDVQITVTRNYGKTAQTKVNNLLSSLFFAILTVVALLAFTLGKREALIVAFAVPLSFSLALFVNFLFGYTINRVTLFALILSLGLVVDDPITNVDNIQRHILMRKHSPRTATLFAVSEVLPPVFMSTLAIIVSFAPMFFITGMMGPYMAPMAANVPLTVIFSTLCAVTIVPWLAHRLLKHRAERQDADQQTDQGEATPLWIKKLYRFVVAPFLESRAKRYTLLVLILVGLLASISLPLLRLVPLKMLPFDNKNELQLVIDMPEGTPLQATDRTVRSFEEYLRGVPEVTDFVSYVGTASPMDFNGMVRHYYLREQGNLADIRINLADKTQRKMQSHGIALRLRKDLTAIARKHGAELKIVEVPPGPPVLSTIVAELYGQPSTAYKDLVQAAEHMKKIMREEPYVVDIDDMTETPRKRIDFVLDKEKASLHGVSTSQVTRTLRLAMSGTTPATIHREGERQALQVKAILPRDKRSSTNDLAQLKLRTADGNLVPLAELGEFRFRQEEQPIYHKNLKRVVYVLAEMAGRAPAEAILDMQAKLEKDPLPSDIKADWTGEGEWKITLRVFRDLGIAFAAALLGIYLILSVQTGSFFLPFVILLAIPLTVLGIMPGFYLLNLITNVPISGFQNPVFFTATSMIGMIALGGIVIRNSVVLIEFIHDSMREGQSFKEAILQSGAIRLRPIVLTAMTTALGAWPITLDPIFSGLAWALIFGLFASTLFTLLIVPVTYYALYRKKYAQEYHSVQDGMAF